jgi:hypothetical protein
MVAHVMQRHSVAWNFDLSGGLYIHTSSCQHQRSELLIGTKYAEIGLWARFMLCAIARDPSQDAYLKSLLHRLDIKTWPQLSIVLSRFLYFPDLFETGAKALFEVLVYDHTKSTPLG